MASNNDDENDKKNPLKHSLDSFSVAKCTYD